MNTSIATTTRFSDFDWPSQIMGVFAMFLPIVLLGLSPMAPVDWIFSLTIFGCWAHLHLLFSEGDIFELTRPVAVPMFLGVGPALLCAIWVNWRLL